MKRARVESCCDWHHSNTRRGCAGLVFNRVVAPWDGKPADAKAADDAESLLIASLKVCSAIGIMGVSKANQDAIKAVVSSA